MAEHEPTQQIRPARRAQAPARVINTLPDKLRAMATRGHQVRAADVATLVRAAALLEEQGAAIDRHLGVYGQTLGELVETRHQLVSIREMLTQALEGSET